MFEQIRSQRKGFALLLFSVCLSLPPLPPSCACVCVCVCVRVFLVTPTSTCFSFLVYHYSDRLLALVSPSQNFLLSSSHCSAPRNFSLLRAQDLLAVT